MSSGLYYQGFAKMVEALSKLSGREFEDVLIDQAGQLLRECISGTHASKSGMLYKAAEVRNHNIRIKNGPKLTGDGYKGRKGWLVDPSARSSTNKYGLFRTGKRMPDEQWMKVLMLRTMLVASRLDPAAAERSRGVLKASWNQIAEDLGPVAEAAAKAPEFVKSANTFKGKEIPKMGSGSLIVKPGSAYVELVNGSELLIKPPGKHVKRGRSRLIGSNILERAIRRRVAAFAKDMESGVFDNVKKRAKRYPGIFVS